MTEVAELRGAARHVERKCVRCEKTKPIAEFVIVGGYARYCRVCHNEKCADWTNKNRTKRRAISRKHANSWRLNNPIENKDKALKTRYGITLEDFDRMHAAQGGKCAICDRPAKLCVDHCHDNKAVRALLCNGCNAGLGHFKHDAVRLRKAAEYVERHK